MEGEGETDACAARARVDPPVESDSLEEGMGHNHGCEYIMASEGSLP